MASPSGAWPRQLMQKKTIVMKMSGSLYVRKREVVSVASASCTANTSSLSHHHRQVTSHSTNITIGSLIFPPFSIPKFIILQIIGWIISFPGSLLGFLKKEEKLIDEIQEDVLEGAELVKLGAQLVEKSAHEVEEMARKVEDIVEKVEKKTKSIQKEVEEVVDAVEESLEATSEISGKPNALGGETKAKIDVVKEKVAKLKETQSKLFEVTTILEAPNTSFVSSSSIMLDGSKALLHLVIMMTQRVGTLVRVKGNFLFSFRAFIMALAFMILSIENLSKSVHLFI